MNIDNIAYLQRSIGDHFDGDDKEPLKAFAANREAVEHEARRKYLAGHLEPDGSILIKTEDI